MAEPHPPIRGVHEAALYVHDLDEAERFWRRLGLPLVGRESGRHVFFRLGDDLLLLFDAGATRQPGGLVPPHGAEGESHVAFDVADAQALERWRAWLELAGIAIEAEVDWPRGGRSLYFRDPSRNSIELITRGSWGF
ncbi:MAG: VOC family protein [Longimicrobiales bacterium]